MQHSGLLSCTTYRMPRGSKGQLSLEFDRFEIAYILALLSGLKPLTDEGRGKLEYLAKTLDEELQTLPYTKARQLKSKAGLELHSSSISDRLVCRLVA